MHCNARIDSFIFADIHKGKLADISYPSIGQSGSLNSNTDKTPNTNILTRCKQCNAMQFGIKILSPFHLRTLQIPIQNQKCPKNANNANMTFPPASCRKLFWLKVFPGLRIFLSLQVYSQLYDFPCDSLTHPFIFSLWTRYKFIHQVAAHELYISACLETDQWWNGDANSDGDNGNSESDNNQIFGRKITPSMLLKD